MFDIVADMQRTQAFLALPPGKSELARHGLLEAGLEAFGEKGLEGATVRDIARKARQNVAAIAYYFGSKNKLYRAVIEGIIRELRARLAEEFNRIAAFSRQREQTPAEALRLLQEFLRAVYVKLLSRSEAVCIARLIVREQTQPTGEFAILYEQGFRPLHEGLCLLVGRILGRDPRDPEIIVRTHLVMGQVYFFAMSREGILRRLGWSSLEGERTAIVTRLLEENLAVLLTGLANKEGSAEPVNQTNEKANPDSHSGAGARRRGRLAGTEPFQAR